MSDKKVIITSDSTCDLGRELAEKYNIGIMPLGVTLGDKSYQDGVDITADDIYAYYDNTKTLPKTSAINIAEAEDFFRQYTEQGYAVVHFTISSEMSTTYRNCLLAAQELDDVYVVDSQNLSTGGGLLVLQAAELAAQGKTAAEIAEIAKETAPKVDASFVIDNLEYLHKGGRCSAVSMLGANLLKLKPCIVVKNGVMGVDKKYRGKFIDTLKEYIHDRIGDYSDICLDRVFVTHAGCDPTIVDAIVAEVTATAPFSEVLITRAGCTVSSHCGANTLGVLFIRKSPIA